MNVLVFNCGSSSLSYRIFQASGRNEPRDVASGKGHRVGVKGTEPSFLEHHVGAVVTRAMVPLKNHRETAVLILRHIKHTGLRVTHVGHRFVHGGSYFSDSVLLDEDVLAALNACAPLAPIHNPTSLSVIEESRKWLPEAVQFVTFDSAFHATLAPHAYTYPLPRQIVKAYGFRKYGFHGLSYWYVSRQAARLLNRPLETLKIVACHLGTGGSSVAAIDGGRSVDTSMGYSPLAGLVMSTRSGDLDPMLAIYLMGTYDCRPDYLMDVLNKQSGLLGLSGFSSDLTDITRRASETGDERAELALQMYIQRLKKYIGSYFLVLGGMDVLVFTDDIGVGNPLVRARVCQDMAWCGLSLDEAANRTADPARPCFLEAKDSKVRILAVPTQEELVICLQGLSLLEGREP